MGNSLSDDVSMNALPSKCKNKIMFYGDSLTEGPYLQPEEKYTAIFKSYVRGAKLDWDVINAGKNGDTIRGSIDRLRYELNTHKPNIVCLCLGGNDYFLGGWNNVKLIKEELAGLVKEIQQRNILVILIGVMPPFSEDVLTQCKMIPEINKYLTFFAMHEQIAEEYKLLYIQSIFEDFPLLSDTAILTKMSKGDFIVRDMFSGDYFLDPIHPNAKGHAIIGKNFFLCIKKYLV